MDQLAKVTIEWPLPLYYRRGSPKRLMGVDLLYDFPWLEQFPDQRAQFKNGLCLALLAQHDCPTGKLPALLLTVREDAAEQPIETHDRFIVVVNLRSYLAEALSNAAASYYANKLSLTITTMSRVSEIVDDPIVVGEVMERCLGGAQIAEWIDGRPDRLQELRVLAGSDDATERPADAVSVAAAINAIKTLDAEQVDALEGLLRGTDRDARLAFLRALTGDEDGRLVTSLAIGERIADRLKDASAAADEFSALLLHADSSETDLQRFIEGHPWLLGLEYVRVLSRHPVPRGSIDFLLERFDGYYDLLELKGPGDLLIEAPGAKANVPPSASSYSLSRPLAQALAQVHVYQDVLTNHGSTLSELYGLEGTRSPRLIIVLGQTKNLTPHCARVLRNLNLSLHRVEIVPFDVLAVRARTIIQNVEASLLAGAPGGTDESSDHERPGESD